MKDNKTILFVVNSDWFFLSHRLPIAKRAIEKGYIVHLATHVSTNKEKIKSYGIHIHNVDIKRSSTSLLNSFFLFLKYVRIFKSIKPDLIHLVTIKPIIIGGLACKFINRSTKLVISVSGLGYIFIDKGMKAFLRKSLIILFYRIVFLQKYFKVIFQNNSDLENISKSTNLPSNKIILIPGSGVDLNNFKLTKISEGKPIVLFPARLLSSKGIYEFVECAKNLKTLGRFIIVGKHDKEARNCIRIKELKYWLKKEFIEYWGESFEMPKIFSKSSIVVLPSYREGMPKSLLEAAACGRPIVTTNVPGCKDAIIEGETGLLVPPYDSQALTNAVEKLLIDRELRKRMGVRGRNFAEKKFDINQVIKSHFEIYENLLSM